jgi:hypothetical protein
MQNQKDERQIAPSRSPLKDLSVCGEVGDLTAVSDVYGKSDAHLPRFFSVSMNLPLDVSSSIFQYRAPVIHLRGAAG